jgi:hypothetical protein
MPATSNLPLRSGKASLYEGGTREPCLVVWPGRIKPGTTNDALFSSLDWYPTLLAMGGLKPRAGLQLDGLDQTRMLLGGRAVRDRVFCHFPHGTPNQAVNIPGFLPGAYVRQGNWKLIRFFADNDDGSDRFELYNLKEDVGETRNLAAAQPKMAGELSRLIGDFLRETEAVIPIRNPNYDTMGIDKTAAADDPLRGWKARGCEASFENGILTLTGTSTAPFLGYSMGRISGPAVLRFRVHSAGGGTGRVQWVPPRGAKNAGEPSSVSFTVPAGDWQEVSVELPADSPLGIVRLFLPLLKQAADLEWIEFKAGRVGHHWSFDGR